MDITLQSIDRGEALRYLGYRRGDLDGRVAAQLDLAEKRTLRLARPRTVYRQFALERTGDRLTLEGGALELEGKSIRTHLDGCGACILMAVTLGAELEGEILRAQVTDMALATIMDACADAAVEQVCDALQCTLEGEARSQGMHLTARFSPGYGDMPLAGQNRFCAVLDTARRIGLTATESHILTPRKSVTALVGLSPVERGESGPGCESCVMAGKCNFRKAGSTCVR